MARLEPRRLTLCSADRKREGPRSGDEKDNEQTRDRPVRRIPRGRLSSWEVDRATSLPARDRPEPRHDRPHGRNRQRRRDGVDIRYEVAGSGEPALVFVHGWSCDRSYWRAQTDHFEASHRVVAIDLGGHGESGLGRKDWTMAAFGGDVRAVVEALGLRKIVLVGHSMGGHVIVEATQLMPDRVAALVLVDTFEDVDRARARRNSSAFSLQCAPTSEDDRSVGASKLVHGPV